MEPKPPSFGADATGAVVCTLPLTEPMTFPSGPNTCPARTAATFHHLNNYFDRRGTWSPCPAQRAGLPVTSPITVVPARTRFHAGDTSKSGRDRLTCPENRLNRGAYFEDWKTLLMTLGLLLCRQLRCHSGKASHKLGKVDNMMRT